MKWLWKIIDYISKDKPIYPESYFKSKGERTKGEKFGE